MFPQRDYKKREFCNDVKCFVQMELNRHEVGSEKYERVRAVCSSACQFTGKDFEGWLRKNGFGLFKDGKAVDFEQIKNADYLTTWRLHKWMTENKYDLAKKG